MLAKCHFAFAFLNVCFQIGRVFYPIAYGADPTGANESSDAFLKTLGDAFQLQNGLKLLPGINDLGGAVIDLQGGNYKINQPLRFPSGGGNVVVSLSLSRSNFSLIVGILSAIALLTHDYH